ncbi:NADP-dependent oxidoreductase [Limnovirga soli]|uniref:Zinc-binding dehydrogenase n=1 Tax=Limnovirga soli TaxID=2656915 RepID=A0A8J8JSC0_9BACT|nr:NADP-dependent oxidoreductase [Limnovirga soli]NNV56792.1 zinc-binding dehydrogenase [Limnovirga soli]
MKAIVLTEKGSFDNVVVSEIEKPIIGDHEILVKIQSAGVNPVDWKAALNGYFPTPLILGSDIAGTIEAVGKAVATYTVGDEIIGSLDWSKQSAFAEYVATREKYITRKPNNISLTDAAAIPLAALTAWQALFDHADIQPGQRIVIHAAAGGVGLFALQFAKWKGAHVIATASSRNSAFLLALGADEVIDYTLYPLSQKVKNVDAVLDSIATPEVQLESFKALKQGGKYVSITAPPREELLKDFNISAVRFLFHSNPVQLSQIVALLEQGIVQLFIEKRFPLKEAKEALAYVHKGRTRGKVVLVNEG